MKKREKGNQSGSGDGAWEASRIAPHPGEFPMDVLPKSIRDVVRNMASRGALDAPVAAVTALTIMSAALGRRLSTKLPSGFHDKPCNLFTLLALEEPPERDAIRYLTQPLLSKEQEAVNEFNSTRGEERLALDLNKLRYQQLVKLLARRNDPEAIEEATRLAEALTSKQQKVPHFCSTIATGAGLRDLLSAGDGACCCLSFEGAERLWQALRGSDSLMRDLLAAGLAADPVRMDVADAPYFGRPCISGLHVVSTQDLRKLMLHDAAPLGFLRTMLILDADRFRSADSHKPSDPPPDGFSGWRTLLSDVLDARLGEPGEVLEWEPKVERALAAFADEVHSWLRFLPDHLHGHFELAQDLAVRIAGVLYAIDEIGLKLPKDKLRGHLDYVDAGMAVARWLFLHRLSVLYQWWNQHLKDKAIVIEQKLQEAGNSMAKSIIRDRHPGLAKLLAEILKAFPKRFEVVVKTTTRGPSSEIVRLKDIWTSKVLSKNLPRDIAPPSP